MYQRYSPGIGPSRLSPAVKNLILANIIVFFISVPFRSFLFTFFSLRPELVVRGMVWQLITYQFLHAGFWHIFWNMFMLYMFGVDLEEIWGTKVFYTFYFICGIGAGLFHMFFNYHGGAIGASGAVYGVLIAYGLSFPNRVLTLLLFFIIPVNLKAIHLVMIMIITTLFFSFSGSADGIAHFAHLGGMVFGYLCLKYNWHYFNFTGFFSTARRKKIHRDFQKRKMRLVKLEYDVDTLLDKIADHGYDSLTPEEKYFLENAGDEWDKFT